MTVAFSPDGKTSSPAGAAAVPASPGAARRPGPRRHLGRGAHRAGLDVKRGTIQVLDNAAWLAACDRLQELGGPPETGTDEGLDPFPLNTDPTARARALMGRGRWDRAASAFDEVIRARPYNRLELARTGTVLLRPWVARGAAADFTAAIATNPEDPQVHYQVAIEMLLAGDLTGYRRTCSGMLRRFRAFRDPDLASRIAYACVHGPEAVEDMASLIEVAERSVSLQPGLEPGSERVVEPRNSCWPLSRGIGCASSNRTGSSYPAPWDWLFLAMIHGGLGHAGEAGQMLARADQWIAEADKTSTWGREYERPSIMLLRREARAVVLYDPIFPADPFAH